MWTAVVIWLYSNVKASEFSWYEDVILDTCCQDIASSDEIWNSVVEHFLQDYDEEINKQNPLGVNGELALAFGELLKKLWSSGRTPVAPRVFKGKLARLVPQFSGYNQHNSQELLTFLLDELELTFGSGNWEDAWLSFVQDLIW